VKKVSSQSKSEELLRASFWGTIPNSLMDLLNAQIHQLHKSRETAQIASIIGRDFDYELMAQVSFLSEEDLKEDLSELLAHRIIEYKETQENAVYFFKHALLKEAAYLSRNASQEKKRIPFSNC
jgi:predicted ATPase